MNNTKKPLQYKLDENKNPVPMSDVVQWAEWMETANRSVAVDKIVIENTNIVITISTVFLGVDNNQNPLSNVPVLFETMVFNGEFDQMVNSYKSWREAEEGHKKVLSFVKNRIWINNIVSSVTLKAHVQKELTNKIIEGLKLEIRNN
jgi:hypothetical protein